MSIHYRRFEARDRLPAYRLFRETIWDYMLQKGMVTEQDSYDLDEYYQQQKDIYIHLEENATEDWVAEDESGNLLGWARSIERDDHLQLTHFFVDAGTQGRGIGRGLLDRTFTVGRGRQRSIIATSHLPALSLYLRYDVNYQSMALIIRGEPQERELETDLTIKKTEPSSQAVDMVLDIESQVLGYKRNTEIEFFMNTQPLFLFYRHSEPVGYAFGSTATDSGPAAALDPKDLPALLHTIEQSACAIGLDTLWLTLPANASHAVRWAFDNGYKIDPFLEFLLAKNPDMKFDRYIMTQATFVW